MDDNWRTVFIVNHEENALEILFKETARPGHFAHKIETREKYQMFRAMLLQAAASLGWEETYND